MNIVLVYIPSKVIDLSRNQQTCSWYSVVWVCITWYITFCIAAVLANVLNRDRVFWGKKTDVTAKFEVKLLFFIIKLAVL